MSISIFFKCGILVSVLAMIACSCLFGAKHHEDVNDYVTYVLDGFVPRIDEPRMWTYTRPTASGYSNICMFRPSEHDLDILSFFQSKVDDHTLHMEHNQDNVEWTKERYEKWKQLLNAWPMIRGSYYPTKEGRQHIMNEIKNYRCQWKDYTKRVEYHQAMILRAQQKLFAIRERDFDMLLSRNESLSYPDPPLCNS